jgi:hypothetical protein
MKNVLLRNTLLSVPLLLLTLVPFVKLADHLNITLNWKFAVLGAFGWWIALLLRMPIMLIARKLPRKRATSIVIVVSGPAEESVRLIVLLIIGLTTRNAYSVGLGWAAIEIVYSVIQGIGLSTLQQRTDTKAKEAKAVLASMGMDKSLTPSAPFWGIAERFSANAIHLSMSLLLVVNPYLVLVTAPAHSLINMLLTKLIKRSMALAEISLLFISVCLFLLSIQLIH